MRRLCAVPAVTLAALSLLAAPALACGGLVAPNGAVNLQRTTTRAPPHEGAERSAAPFESAGGPNRIWGSIIPPPGPPPGVGRGGGGPRRRLKGDPPPPILQLGPTAALAA